MENEKLKRNLLIALIISILLNVSLFFVLGNNDSQWEDFNNKNNFEWCEMVNQGNEVINILLEQLRDYDEEYNIVLDIEMMECFS